MEGLILSWWVMRTLISSVDSSADEFANERAIERRWGLRRWSQYEGRSVLRTCPWRLNLSRGQNKFLLLLNGLSFNQSKEMLTKKCSQNLPFKFFFYFLCSLYIVIDFIKTVSFKYIMYFNHIYPISPPPITCLLFHVFYSCYTHINYFYQFIYTPNFT